tara:strand:+ start:1019 stop:1255 length:237 start_codon:yes stop_codon:yes gene_type:complete
MNIEVSGNNNIDTITLQKMTLIYNALENGWCIKKINNCYVFNKKHNNEKKVYLDSYLRKFMMENMDISNILNDENKNN